MNERRLARLQEQIKQRLAEVLQREIADPKLGLVTITRVELDREFTQCKAFWSVIAPTGQEERARKDSQNVLTRARGFCQREMGKVLHTRSVPHLEFRFDEGIGNAIRIQQLLHDLKDEHAPRPDAAAGDAPTSDGDPSDGGPSAGGPSDAPSPDTPHDS